MSICSSCGSPIIWAISVNGRPIPVNRDPSPKGNLTLTRGTDGAMHALVVVHDGGGQALPRHTSHFADCPNAAEHRRTIR